MSNTSWKYTLWRAARTFVQVAVPMAAAIIAEAVKGGEGLTKSVVTYAVISAVAAGIAALMNLPEKDLTAGVERVTVNMGVTSIDELPIAGQDGTDEEAGDGDE